MTPPIADKRPHEITTHGHTRTDDYFWLREKTNPEVITHLEAENAYMEAQTAHTKDLQQTLYEEMVGRIKETDDSVPVKEGDYYYYSRTVEGQQYSIYCRKHGSLEADEEVLVDLNAIWDANEFKYLRMGVYETSPNHKLLAYGLDTTGAETYTVRFLNLETGEHLEDVIENAAGSAEFVNNTTLFYTTEEEDTKRSDKLFRHTLGTAQSDDVLVYHEPDQLYSVYPYMTKDKKYLFTGSFGIETYENWFVAADNSSAELTLMQPREEGIRYTVSHRNGLFYIVTNADDATNNKLMTTTPDAPSRDNWQVLIEHRSAIKLEGIDLFANFMVRYERENGLKTIQIQAFDTDETHAVTMPESVYTISGGANPDANSGTLRFSYTSMVTPSSTFDYDMVTREMELKKQQPVLGGYDSADYTTFRIFASAEDGKQIPISIVHRKDAFDGSQPTFLHLYGYGSYGITVDPTFSSARLSLLNRGMIFAVAHVRGSQIMGREWYEDGKFLNKRNTFTDFVACALHVIAEGYTTPDLMSMEGRSAGGLLMGTVLNIAPHLFKAAIAGVPFVDVISTMLDESIPLTTGEFAEWGNPMDAEYYWYMLGYSPYDNVKAQRYPNLLVTAGLNDPRVQYWEPAKWVAKLRDTKTDDNKLILKMIMGAGHFASSGRYDYLKDVAFDYAFLIDQLGMDK
ncbi:MAG: S9 family peptidase [Candidatus Promineifilaceae bacterium]